MCFAMNKRKSPTSDREPELSSRHGNFALLKQDLLSAAAAYFSGSGNGPMGGGDHAIVSSGGNLSGRQTAEINTTTHPLSTLRQHSSSSILFQGTRDRDKMVRIYFHDGLETDQRLPHEGEPATVADLNALGVFADNIQEQAEVDRIAKERGYKNRDEVGSLENEHALFVFLLERRAEIRLLSHLTSSAISILP